MNYSQFTTEELAAEVWKPVVGFEGVYSVSNLGRVRREKGFRCRKTRVLKPGFNASYLFVVLCVDGIHHRKLVHVLVAAAFIGPRPLRHQVNHIDGIKTNNKAANLEYVTPSENQFHALDVLHVPNRLGEEVRTSKLTVTQVESIREIYAAGNITISNLAERFKVSRSNIHSILKGMSWRRNGGSIAPKHPKHSRKLQKNDVVEIRRLLREGVPQQVIADKFQVNNASVSMINTRKTWKNVP